MIKIREDRMLPYHQVQTLEFLGREEHTYEIQSTNLNIIGSPGGHRDGSSKVKLKSIVDFTWEHRYYMGQLMAVHMSTKFLAYALNGKADPAGSQKGLVRVLSKDFDERILIKGIKGLIQDITFAHIEEPLLAFVDVTGSLHVVLIEISNNKLNYSYVLQVNADDSPRMSHRVIWCPYIPDDEANDGDEVSKLLILTRGSKIELWSVAVASQLFPSAIQADNQEAVKNKVMTEIYQHTGNIIEATLSPDGTALATASADGEIKFFQVFLVGTTSGQECKCLHQWQPHGGEPISCMFFLDDHKNFNTDTQFWRFAVTGCNNNTVIKLWSCESWTCLQTINFAPHPLTGKMPVLKAGLDLAASYLFLSDIYNKVLYIFSILKDSEDAVACLNTVSEFLLPSSFMSFSIVEAGQRRLRFTSDSMENLCPTDDENEEQLVVRLFLVQPKSMQECHIAFRPPVLLSNSCLMDTLANDSLDYNEDLPVINTTNHNGIEDVNDDDEGVNGQLIEIIQDNITEAADMNHSAGLNLMTPDAFSSPAKKETALDSKSSSPQLGNIESASPSIAQAVQALNTSDKPLATGKLEEQAPPSGGSSPSREVRQILSSAEPEESETEIKPEVAISTNENWSQIPLDAFHAMQEQGKEDVTDGQLNIKKELTPVLIVEEPQNKWNISNDIVAMTSKLDAIIEIIQDQQQEISELRVEVTRLRQETPLTNRLETAFAKSAQQQNTSIEQNLLAQAACQHEFLKSLEDTVKEKIEKTIPRCVQEVVEPLKKQLRIDASKIDSMVQDNMTKLLGGTHVRDAITAAVTSAAKPTLEYAFKQAFTSILLPGMEKACQNMFKQVQDAFIAGTREYLHNVDGIMDKQYQKQNKHQSEALTSAVREQVQTEFSRGLTMIQENTIRSMRDSLKENFTQHMSDISGIRSRATTPGLTGPTVADAQTRVLSLLHRGQLNTAFQQALSASDLNVVVLACESIDPACVFNSGGPGQNPRCVLQQPVLLSLIQQLSANLGHRTELKHRWLEEALLSLDPNDPVTREHMVAVLLGLQTQVAAFISANPAHRLIRRLKMVTMVAQTLMKSG
ncbi:enhancer of mRNA-decapping protein 4 [Copidosoma floridanum]|uniref:enhancer of mRNA-decapping protein 4 n=1 Tax=Copidosoma floridanum TaxID=29053 RepID=UPI0006C95744|nr:enhancer of mRNA-decapping protein 4 [Copidosoma floridanum]